MTNTVFFTTLRYTDQASDTSEIASNDENGTADDGSSGIDFGVPPQTIDNGGLVAKVALQSITKMICFSSLVSLDDQKEELLGVPTELAVDHTIDHQIQKQVQLHDTHRRHKPNSRLFINQVGSSNWPDWLLAVAGEAIEGWTPRQLHTFQVLAKIRDGRRSHIYKARDVLVGKVVALKKVKLHNLDSMSVEIFAREIFIFRRLHHPNVIKLLSAIHRMKFTEPQVKCNMCQLLSGLNYCHSQGVIHRNISRSNILIDSGGILKIAGFGSASFFSPDPMRNPIAIHKDTVWGRPPEHFHGATNYGVGVDLYGAGCMLVVDKPTMDGRMRVEKLQRVFKLFESSSEEHWKMLKLQEDSILKLQHPYDRCIEETLKDIPSSSLPLIETLLAIDPAKRQTATAALMSEFFRAKPYACKPSDLPYYPPTGNSVKLQAIAIKFVGRRRLLDSRENSNADGVSKTLAPDRFVNSIPVSQANKDFHNEFSGAKYCRDQPLVNPQINKSVQGVGDTSNSF
ncbi:hypothetical protein C5167_015524 [Papaver somniferum]|uniref:Protein kinase domain-containing protein n=1 Tax=Papaver somniferum TaxID=3469 RepID=A0A4Y7J9R0_PAPSO|nr:hypothetical protein C5167_015524 [Papaver somniferum]